MEVFICNVSFTATSPTVAAEIARVLHGPEYQAFNRDSRVNFNVTLKPSAKGKHGGARGRNGGIGSLTLPSVELGERFLSEYGGRNSRRKIFVNGRALSFDKSKRKVGEGILEQIRRLPFVDPIALQKQEELVEQLSAEVIPVKDLQFGWHCRDDVISIECELEGRLCDGRNHLQVDVERREIRIRVNFDGTDKYVVIHFNQIDILSASNKSGQFSIYMLLLSPCIFERDLHARPSGSFADLFGEEWLREMLGDNGPKRRRLSHLGFGDHEHYAPYTSYSVRVVCRNNDLDKFKRICNLAGLQKPGDYDYPVETNRRLFSKDAKDVLERWLSKVSDYQVAYQVNALLGDGSLDMMEAIELIPGISQLVKERGPSKTVTLLKRFHAEVRTLWSQGQDSEFESVEDCFQKCTASASARRSHEGGKSSDPDDFECHHVTVTPTAVILEGPSPERSNRIIRKYINHQQYFLKVSFTDEDKLEYRFDRELDSVVFIKDRVGHYLHNGLTVAGRHFEFLGYSQSALKEHAVWFVTPFVDSTTNEKVDAKSIIKSIGKFHGLPQDPRLMHCPARYGARISQAFTTTDASVVMEAEEIITDVGDIKRNGHCFTDGIGTMSLELAHDIWAHMSPYRRRNRVQPKAFQIRLMGSKGVLSVDYKSKGRTVSLRDSMIKFDAPDSTEIEVANAFDKPTIMFLNRPLIMLLEGLGVPSQVFEDLQDKAVAEITEATKSTKGFSKLLETYGLGSSFRLSSIFLNLAKLGLSLNDSFYQHIVDFAKNHIMREIKHKARIPVRGWNLVGVADVHGYLEEGEVFVCVHYPGQAPFYLEGPVLVSRSPTIHPGDVQIAQAIGKPPPGSPFETEPLDNTVVFSIQGVRPLPSYLGGGDLDGDTFNVSDFLPLHPPRCRDPAGYEAAVRKEVDHISTMSDVADFVVDYINSDVVGVIASNWLLIADQSTEHLPGIFEGRCLTLARLHSDAVDFPKSGNPVAVAKIPKLLYKAKPDWSAPETMNLQDDSKHYQSRRAIGKLFRAIELMALPNSAVKPADERRVRHAIEDLEAEKLERMMARATINDGVYGILRHKVDEYIDVDDVKVDDRKIAIDVFKAYSSELKYIAMTNTLSANKTSRLSEEEVVVGTIVAKTAQQRRRKDMTSKLREQATALVRDIRMELIGEEADDDEKKEVDVVSHYKRMKRAWTAFEMVIVWSSDGHKGSFAVKSFEWICLGLLFDAIKALEEDDRRVASGSYYWKPRR